MKKIKSLLYIALTGLVMTFTSCKDWLTLMPLNEVVLENFWTEKADVESVLLGAYSALNQDAVQKMLMFGEMRSDNIVANTTADNNIIQITKDNILETNPNVNWSVFYSCINIANNVMHFAPQVAEKDPNYTDAELKSHIAEATALRALCYWYLIRAYRDVPYVTRPSIDATEEFFVPAEKFEVILESLMADLEEVKNFAVNKFVNEYANTARFTRVGIEALLSDLYLWKGDWDNCIAAVDRILERKMFEYDELMEDDPNACTVEIFRNKYPLITNVWQNEFGNAYNEIFGVGNSFETLFELAFSPSSGQKFNVVSSNFVNNEGTTGNLKPEPRVASNFTQGTNTIFESEYDGRFYESITESSSADYSITKYVYSNISYKLQTGQVQDLDRVQRGENTDITWVIYRLTDVLLMQAEAMTMKAMEMGNEITGDTLAARNSLLENAFAIVQTVNSRAKGYNIFPPTDTIPAASYKTNAKQMEELVLKERRRELLFEGKRWFDLVRMARRDGNTERLTQLVLLKYTENVSAVRIKLADMNAIYWPILKDELKINTLLKQNPAYEEDEFIEKN
mgnify:FL=1